MKIVLLAYLHGFGGAEKQIIMLANELSNRKHNVFLLSLGAHNLCFEVNSNVTHYKVEDKSKIKISKIAKRFFLIAKILFKIMPDVTINFWLQPLYLIVLMPKKYFGKLIYSERGDPADKEYSGILGVLRYLSFLKVDKIVFQSRAAQKYFGNSVVRKSSIIPNPVIIRNELLGSWSGVNDAIVAAGRLSEEKKFDNLILAFSKLASNFPCYKVFIYGEGEKKEYLCNLIKTLRMEKRIFIYPPTKNLHNIMKNCKLFVLSSRNEGMPNVLLEALAIGLPCISTNYAPRNSVLDIISHGFNGLVSENNAIDLSEKISILLNDKELCRELSKNAILKSLESSPQMIWDKWEKEIS